MDRPTSSFKTLLRLSALSPLEWVAGADQAADTIVTWVTVDQTAARQGDVLVLAAQGLSPQVLAAGLKKEIAGIIVVRSAAEAVPSLDAEFPVISHTTAEDLETIYRLLLTALIDQRAHLMAWGSDIHTRLDRLVADGAGLKGLTLAMTEISGRGVIVQDKRLNVLASSPSHSLEEVWGALIQDVAEPDLLPEALRDRKQAGKTPVSLSQDLPGGLSRLITSINVGGVARGYLSLVGLAGDLDDLDMVVADQGALACAVQMSRSKAVRETEKRLHGDLLTALLQDNLSSQDSRLWVEAMGLDLDQDHVALRFCWDSEPRPTIRRLETLVNGEVARLGLSVIINPMASEVICFCQVPAGFAQPRDAILLGQGIQKRALQENPNAPVRCGIGSAASDLNQWGNSFRQAGQALKMAARLSEDKPLYFPELSVYRLLLQIEDSPELLDFHSEILGPLIAYDTGEELINTLKSYFEHNGNLSQTAEALYIHRNSLLYRMGRIAEITGLDLDNPETRLAVQLALHIHQMQKNVPGS